MHFALNFVRVVAEAYPKSCFHDSWELCNDQLGLEGGHEVLHLPFFFPKDYTKKKYFPLFYHKSGIEIF